MVKTYVGLRGYYIEVDGQESDPHLFGFPAIVKGPSGTFYCANIETEDSPAEGSKVQMYKLVPVDSLTEYVHLDEDDDTLNGYVEDEPGDEDGEEGVEDEEEAEGDEDGEDDEPGSDDEPEELDVKVIK